MALFIDYLIVGAGLTGSVIARTLSDAGYKVLVIERRSHIGGNVHDHVHRSGIRIHTYGPHYFRTSSKRIWDYVKRFAKFDKYKAVLKSYVDGHYENWPVAASYIQRTIGEQWEPGFKGIPTNFEEASLAMMPRLVYEKFVKGYTEKQWGVSTYTLSASLAKRFEVRQDDYPFLKRHKYQGIPTEGYTSLMRNLLSGIPIILNCDYFLHREYFKVQRMLIFTGPIDEFFGFDLGRLAYRGQQREHVYLSDVDYALPSVQVNNPSRENGAYIRTIEWKQMMLGTDTERLQGTVLTKETPFSPINSNDYEYPFPDEKNQHLYKCYRKRAEAIPGLLICGRLGEYRYYDMDQAIGRALVLAKRLLE